MGDMERGYEPRFIMKDANDIEHEYQESTLLYIFKSTKSNHTYQVRVEKYKDSIYCIKFYDKANRLSRNKYSLRTNTFEVRTIMYTLINILKDVLIKDEMASFFFIGANDEKDAGLISNTRRYLFYKKFVLSTVSQERFAHYANDKFSLYMLLNQNIQKKHHQIVNSIVRNVANAFNVE